MIIFENDGLLDIMAVKTMGVSVKEAGAIGYFGTGLKFAIAVLLRTKHSVSIFIDGEEHRFTTKPVMIRERSFNIVYMNDEALAFTDELGKNWLTWMAFRELASNAMDEGGSYRFIEDDSDFEKPNGKTVIAIKGDDIEQSYNCRDDIFFNKKGAHITALADVVQKESLSIFYKGVNVATTQKPCIMTYNLKQGIELTEDRTANSEYALRREVARFILKEANEDEIYYCLKAHQSTFESDIDFNIWVTPSNAFINVCKRIVDNKETLSMSAFKVYKEATGYIEEDEPMQLNKIQQSQLDRAIGFASHLEPDIVNMNIIIQSKLNGDALGLANVKTQKIYLSKRVFEQGTKQVATTLLEEYYHIRYNYQDNTYPFQSFLFDVIISLLEQVKDEAL